MNDEIRLTPKYKLLTKLALYAIIFNLMVPSLVIIFKEPFFIYLIIPGMTCFAIINIAKNKEYHICKKTTEHTEEYICQTCGKHLIVTQDGYGEIQHIKHKGEK